MLEDFLQKQEIDIIFLQEVTRPVFDDIRGFTVYTNIATTGRGTAILTRDHIQLMNTVCVPTGRGMAAQFQNVTIVNIYAPSGAERNRNRENLFSNELPYLLRDIPPSFLVGDGFNCVLANIDATGHPNYSRALQEFIRGFDLLDMWKTSQERATYTHYTSRGVSRIDRIYASRNLSRHKRGAETRVAAFTDHLAVVVKITLEATTMRRGRGYWKMNAALLSEERFQEQLRRCWTEWSKQTKNYPTMVMWWERVAKMRIKKLFIREGTVKRREETQMENLYYACLYDILQRPIVHAERRAALNHLKAKIVKLHNARLAGDRLSYEHTTSSRRNACPCSS
jgi:exonuclease III